MILKKKNVVSFQKHCFGLRSLYPLRWFARSCLNAANHFKFNPYLGAWNFATSMRTNMCIFCRNYLRKNHAFGIAVFVMCPFGNLFNSFLVHHFLWTTNSHIHSANVQIQHFTCLNFDWISCLCLHANFNKKQIWTTNLRCSSQNIRCHMSFGWNWIRLFTANSIPNLSWTFNLYFEWFEMSFKSWIWILSFWCRHSDCSAWLSELLQVLRLPLGCLFFI